MNPEGGYTRQYRRMWDNPVFRNYQEAAVFSWMKDMARWKPCRVSTKFGPVDLDRGELIMAEREVAENFGLARSTLRGLLQRMNDQAMIEVLKDRCPQRAGTVFRIVNYDGYQPSGDDAGEGADLGRTAKEPHEGPQTGPETNRKPTAEAAGKVQILQDVALGSSVPQDRMPTANVTEEEPQACTKQDQDKRRESKEVTRRGEGGARAAVRPLVSPEALQVIRAFDEVRTDVFGQEHRRLSAHNTDPVFAQRWLDAGADLSLCEFVFRERCQDLKGKGQGPPGTLKFLNPLITAALGERNRPTPEGHPDEQRYRQPHRAAGADIDQAVLRGVWNAMAPELEGD